MLAGESWAEELYIKTVFSLQSLTHEDLPTITDHLESQTAAEVLDHANEYLLKNPQPQADTVYGRLKDHAKSTRDPFQQRRSLVGEFHRPWQAPGRCD